MKNSVKALLIGAGAVVIYNAGKFLGGIEYTRVIDKALEEHDLTIKEAHVKVPLWAPIISSTNVVLEKLNKVSEEESQ